MNTAVDLEQQQTALAAVQRNDFRSASLFHMVNARLKAGRVIDVGCGAGGMVSYLLEQGRDALGIDTNETIIKATHRFFTSRNLDPARIQLATAGQFVKQGQTAENVISMDCLEHVENDSAFFDELVQLVAIGGRLIITVPAVPQLYGQRDRDIGHYRRYNQVMLRRLIARHPLKILELRYWNLLGVAPVFVAEKLLKRRVPESFRYGPERPAKRVLRTVLSYWFSHVEQHIHPPVGLTLLAVLQRDSA